MRTVQVQRWMYWWEHKPTGNKGLRTTLREMTMQEFLSCLAWWNLSDEWRYWPAHTQEGIMAQHECANVEKR